MAGSPHALVSRGSADNEFSLNGPLPDMRPPDLPPDALKAAASGNREKIGRTLSPI
jgi:hypothetical protein